MVTLQHSIRTVMLSSRDAKIINLWAENHPSPYTRGCYRFDSERLLDHVKKPLARITLADLQSFAQALTSSGLAPISRARTLAAWGRRTPRPRAALNGAAEHGRRDPDQDGELDADEDGDGGGQGDGGIRP